MPERIGDWPFTFPPQSALTDLKVSDVFVLIRRAVADGQKIAQAEARSITPGSAADMVASGFDNKRELLGG